ncbi:hypothetical protein [Agarivorans sp. Alg241-V36]|uniref:hypothetical protein n=1 Tax=Agarivorans sp. Alg241-V36 TaxID=2305992 RepID=UPI0013D4A592|nr:hypothetical protein [Agarivorans sp. Alg241-V36]
MKKLAVKTWVMLALAAPYSVFAHPGHDHQSSWSMLIHLLWLAPIVVAGGLLFATHNKTTSKK